MERRDRVALGLALAAHAAIFVVARGRLVRAVPPPSSVAPLEVAIDVEPTEAEPASTRVEAPAATPASEDREPRAVATTSIRPSAIARPAAGSQVPSVQAPESLPTAPSDSAPPATPPEASASTPSRPAVTLAQLGLEGPNPFVAAAPSAPAAEALEGVNRSIADSLLRHDRSVGLGSEGPAIAVIEETVFRSTTSVNGRAVLSVVADATGLVTAVTCIDGDRAQWDALASQIASLLHDKHLRTAPGGRGVEMRIEVTSREELPSGRDPGLEVDLLKVPGAKPITLKKGRGPKSSKVALLDVHPKIVVDDPNADETDGPPTAAASRFPTAHIELMDIVKVELDPIDLAGKARRVVHAKVLQEHPL